MVLKALGQYDTEGQLIPYAEPVLLHRFGNTLRDEDGIVWAVLDEYSEWVSASLKKINIRSVIKVESDPKEGKDG